MDVKDTRLSAKIFKLVLWLTVIEDHFFWLNIGCPGYLS